LLLASFGLFSVACYSIANRTREFGIRIALGAAPRAVLRSAMQSLAAAVVAGLVIGLALGVALGSVLTRWSIPSPKDPLVLSGVVATLLLSVLAATLIPARRAISVEPAVALRAD
jgi:ABC-type antimicrobial peptide transport system permease subunit